MDNLAKDAAAARAAGMSYGQYMAAKERTSEQEVMQSASGRDEQLFCTHCGKPISDHTRQRLYCGEECRRLETLKRAHEKYLKKTGLQEAVARACPVCGSTFATTDRRRITCSPICSKVARSQRIKKYQEEKRTKESA